jgi:excisionase family DNA binding protein
MAKNDTLGGTTVIETMTTYLTRSDVARLLGVSPNTVTRWAREGRLPCQVTLGGHHRFDLSVIEALRDSLSRGASSVTAEPALAGGRTGGER